MSPARKPRRGALVPLLLIGFLLVATSVIWRRSRGLSQARAIAELERKRATLAGDRVRLDGEIRTARGRARLLPIAESRLGMRVPPDSNVVILPRPSRDAPAAGTDTSEEDRTTNGPQ